jgi:hypothetical protein
MVAPFLVMDVRWGRGGSQLAEGTVPFGPTLPGWCAEMKSLWWQDGGPGRDDVFLQRKKPGVRFDRHEVAQMGDVSRANRCAKKDARAAGAVVRAAYFAM